MGGSNELGVSSVPNLTSVRFHLSSLGLVEARKGLEKILGRVSRSKLRSKIFEMTPFYHILASK